LYESSGRDAAARIDFVPEKIIENPSQLGESTLEHWKISQTYLVYFDFFFPSQNGYCNRGFVKQE